MAERTKIAALMRRLQQVAGELAEVLEQEAEQEPPKPLAPAVLPCTDTIRAEAIRLSRLHGLPAGRTKRTR